MKKNNYTGKEEYVTHEDGTRVLLDADDSPPLDDTGLAQMRPAKDVLPPAFMRAWKEGRVGRPPADRRKQQVTVRLDADVLFWLKQEGTGYQTRINRILRQAMEHGGS